LYKHILHALDLDSIIGATTPYDGTSNPQKQKQSRDLARNTLLNDSRWIDMLELFRQSPKVDPEIWAKQLVSHAPIELDFGTVLGVMKVCGLTPTIISDPECL
jgi:hypothetical protein